MDFLVMGIKEHLRDQHGANDKVWCRGYISALYEAKMINNNQYLELLDWLARGEKV